MAVCAFAAVSVLPVPAHATRPQTDPSIERWKATALEVGWSETQWPWLACTIARESHGDPTAWNGRDPGYGSYGLVQLNMSKGRSGTWAIYGPLLGGDITTLYDPQVNLAVALDLHARAQRMWGDGRRPWGRSCR